MKIGMRIPGKLASLGTAGLVEWAKSIGLDSIDLPRPDKELKEAMDAAGLIAGSVDIRGVGDSLSKDDTKREQGVSSMKADMDEAAALGLKTIFVCLIPSNPTTPRRETFDIFVETYPDIVAHAESLGLSLAMEPYPGPAPHYPTIGCTPEMYRAMFEAIPSEALGICYDPSHYVRLGIDYMRVLDEFGDRIRHAHGKDTEILGEGLYSFGNIGATFPQEIGWSGGNWRYTIPGAGEVNWSKVGAHLAMLEYDGVVSIELEDHVYGHTLEGSKEGIIRSMEHLRRA